MISQLHTTEVKRNISYYRTQRQHIYKHQTQIRSFHLFMEPKREKMISRSSSVVTGFSLHTNSTFSGGLTSASGRSPTCRNVPLKSWRNVSHASVALGLPGLSSSHHLQQDGPGFGFFFIQPLLQLLGSSPLCIVNHLICSNSTTLHTRGRNSCAYLADPSFLDSYYAHIAHFCSSGDHSTHI